VALGLAWLLLGKDRPPLGSLWPALLGGLVLSLPGLVPPLLLNWRTDSLLVRQANVIYVYERLPHHLNPWRFPLEQLVPFAVICVLWLLLNCTRPLRVAPIQPEVRRLRAFVVAALAIALAGMAGSLLSFWDPVLAAGLLRFYWFRLADVAVPMGVALFGVRWIISRDGVRRAATVAVVALAGFHLADCVVMRLFSLPPHAERLLDFDAWAAAGRWVAHPRLTTIFPRQPRADRLADYAAWREACDWAARDENVPPDATFLTPRMSQTFKWYAGRGEAGTWKEIPQDARGIDQWWRRMQAFFATGDPPPWDRWYNSPGDLGAVQLRQLAAAYHFQYVVTPVGDRLLPLPVVYQNRGYVIYRMEKQGIGKDR
jgi:hypothetical protein